LTQVIALSADASRSDPRRHGATHRSARAHRQGEIGLAAFGLLVNDPRFRDHPMVLELPLEEVKQGLDALRGRER
jgi:hypothetical protein